MHEGNWSIEGKVIVNIRFSDDNARFAGEMNEFNGLVDRLNKT